MEDASRNETIKELEIELQKCIKEQNSYLLGTNINKNLPIMSRQPELSLIDSKADDSKEDERKDVDGGESDGEDDGEDDELSQSGGVRTSSQIPNIEAGINIYIDKIVELLKKLNEAKYKYRTVEYGHLNLDLDDPKLYLIQNHKNIKDYEIIIN